MTEVTVRPSLRVRLLVLAGVLLSGLPVLLLSAPVPTAREDPEVVFTCGRLVVPHEGKRVVVDRVIGSGLPCEEAHAVVTDAVRGRDVGARRGFSCQIVPPFKDDDYKHPGSGDCMGWDGGGVHWSLR